MSEAENLLGQVKETAKQGGTGKKTYRNFGIVVAPSILGEAGESPLTFQIGIAKVDTDHQPVNVVKVRRSTGERAIGKEVFVNHDGKIDLKGFIKRMEFTADKFDPASLKEGKNSFLEEIVQAGTVDPIPVDDITYLEDGDEVSKFEMVKEFQVESTLQLSRIPEHKFKELYMIKANKGAKESGTRIAKLARTLLERDLALVGFFSFGGWTYYTGVIHPYERKADGRLWLLLGTSEGRLIFDEAWSLADAKGVKLDAVPMIVRKTPKAKISA